MQFIRHAILLALPIFISMSLEGGVEKPMLNTYVPTIEDFPEPGIKFRDISPLLANPEAFHECIETFAKQYEGKEIDAILGLDARGFIFGTALAYRLKLPFVPVRKKGKLPGETLKVTYQKEYGPDQLEIPAHALKPGQKAVVIDDVLATGGTAAAACQLVTMAGAEVLEVGCLLEVPGLKGRENLPVPLFLVIESDA
jgi:adenine phosphoribosyltransferase